MPRYRVNINYIPTANDVDKMLDRTKTIKEGALIVTLFLTGARPGEVSIMKKKDVTVKGDVVEFKLRNLKIGKRGFFPEYRILPMATTSVFMDVLFRYLNHIGDEDPLFPITVRRIEQIVSRVSEYKLCPYNFRHGRLTTLAREGASVDFLMSWKGAKKLDSVSPYIRAKKIEKITNIK